MIYHEKSEFWHGEFLIMQKTVQLLEFQDIWQKIVQGPRKWSITKNLNFDKENF